MQKIHIGNNTYVNAKIKTLKLFKILQTMILTDKIFL